MANQHPLTHLDIEKALLQLPGWEERPSGVSERGTELVKTYQFSDYVSALNFLNKASEHIEAVQHHPTWELSWGRAKARLTTDDIGHQISQADLDLATYLESLYSELDLLGQSGKDGTFS